MFSLEGGQAAATRLIQRGVTAIICASDIAGARRDPGGAPARASTCPRDVSVVGFDDSAFMTCTDPPLTTVRQPIEAMGQAAVSQLLSQVGGGEVSSEELLFEPELVVRVVDRPRARRKLRARRRRRLLARARPAAPLT